MFVVDLATTSLEQSVLMLNYQKTSVQRSSTREMECQICQRHERQICYLRRKAMV